MYDDQVDASIANEFATVAFRFGHTLIASFFNGNGGWPLKFHFFEFDDFVLGHDKSGRNWFSEMREASRQTSPSADTAMVQDVTNFLFCRTCFGSSGFGDDLAARNIQRGRDHGIPSYNRLRAFCNLTPLSSMNERPPEINVQDWANLAAVYTSVDQIDGFSGGLAEQPTDSDSLVGPTFSCIIANQFKRLMQGDRFFFAHPPEGDLDQRGLKLNSRRTVQSRSLSDIICDNTDVQDVPKKAMQPSALPVMSCVDAVGLDFDAIAADINPAIDDTVVLLTAGFNTNGYGYNIVYSEFYPTSTGCVVPPSSIHLRGHTSFLTAEPVLKLAHCGGLQTGSISSICSVFNPATQTWDENEIGKMTQPRWMHAAVTLTNVGTYIFGGYYEPTPGTSEFLPRGSRQWVVGPKIPNLGPNLQVDLPCTVAISDFSILLFHERDIFEYQVDIANPVKDDGWQERSKWPQLLTTRMYPLGCSRIKTKVVIAGYDISTEILDLVTRTIKYAGNMSSTRSGFYLGTIKTNGIERVIALGGYENGWNGASFKSVEEFNPETETWSSAPANLSKGRGYFGAVVVPKSLFC